MPKIELNRTWCDLNRKKLMFFYSSEIHTTPFVGVVPEFRKESIKEESKGFCQPIPIQTEKI